MSELKAFGQQVKRMGGLSGYPKDIPEAANELARKLQRGCRHLDHAEATISAVLEEDERKFCPTPAELQPYIDRTAATFTRLPKSCTSCIEGWVQSWWLMTRRPFVDREDFRPGWNKEELTIEQYNGLIPKVDNLTQRVYEAVKPCTCQRGAVADANWDKYMRETAGEQTRKRTGKLEKVTAPHWTEERER